MNLEKPEDSHGNNTRIPRACDSDCGSPLQFSTHRGWGSPLRTIGIYGKQTEGTTRDASIGCWEVRTRAYTLDPPKYRGQPRSLGWTYNRATSRQSRLAPSVRLAAAARARDVSSGEPLLGPVHRARGEPTLPAKAGEM